MINIHNIIRKDYIYIFVLFLLFIIVTIQIVSRLINSHLDYDESYNLQISQNIQTNGQYATYDKIFDPYITTGPTVLLPASLLINQQYPLLPRLIPVFYAIVLVIITFKFILVSKLQKIIYLVLLNIVPLFYFFSSHVLGEIPAFTFFIVSLFLVSKRQYVLAGIFFSLSVLTKTMFLLSLIPIVYLIISQHYHHNRLRYVITSLTKFACGSFIVIVLWNFFILWQLQFDINSYLKIVVESYEIYHKKSASNLGLIHGRLEMITWVFKIDAKIFVITTLIATTLTIKKFIKHSSFLVSLSLFYICLLMYFLLIGSTNWYRHFFPAVICLSLIIPYLIGNYIEKINKEKLYISAIGILITVLLIFSTTSSKRYAYFQIQQRIQQNLIFEHEGIMPLWKQDRLLVSQIATKNFILQKLISTKKIAGIEWWNAPEISYLIGRRIYRNPFDQKIDYLIFHIYGDKLAPEKMKKVSLNKSQIIFEDNGYKIATKSLE